MEDQMEKNKKKKRISGKTRLLTEVICVNLYSYNFSMLFSLYILEYIVKSTLGKK